MSADSFEGTRELDSPALRALLAAGRPEQRVWAAWQLALRLGAATPHIVQHLRGEPSAGVRRALLVVLAGHDEIDLLVMFARRDPSADVRAEAIKFVMRWVTVGKVPFSVVTEAYADGPSQVRVAILGEVTADPPSTLRALVVQGLDHGAPAEQIEAFEAALRSGTQGIRDRAMRWLDKSTGELARAGWLRLQFLAPAEIVSVLMHASRELRMRAITELTAIPVAALAELAIDRDQRSFLLFRARPDFQTAPAELLARALLSGLATGFLEELTARLAALAAVPEPLAPLVPRLRDHVKRRLVAIAEGNYLDDERSRYKRSIRAAYRALLQQIDRVASAPQG